MADAIITKLNSLPQLTVRPTSTIEKYSDTNDPIAVGRELQVEAVLDGKIQRADNRIRISVQILRVADGATLWAGSFDDYFTNIFAVQDSISERMLETLSVKLSGSEVAAISKRYTENTEAYQLFLKGQFYQEQISREGTENALKYYRAAVERDPDYALAWAASAPAYIHLANLNLDRDNNIRNAREAATRAAELDPELADAHEALADVYDVLDWNWEAADAEYRKAIELNPRREGPHFSYSSHLSREKRHDEAVLAVETARRINPVALYIQNHLIHTLLRARRFEEAVAAAQKSLEMSPDNPNALNFLFRIYMYQGRFVDARAILDRYLAIKAPQADVFEAWYLLKTGKREAGERGLRTAIENYKSTEAYGPAALNAVRLGAYDEAFHYLEKAYQRREYHLLTINIEPDWDPIRDDPRFIELIHRMRLPE